MSSWLVVLWGWIGLGWAEPVRVVVVGAGPGADHASDVLQRTIRSQIARSDAAFYPEIDLFQAGRRRNGVGVQPAQVPDEVAAELEARAQEQLDRPWNATSEEGWAGVAESLSDRAREIWFVDRPELRRPLFLLYAAIGYAAENTNQGRPPFYDQVAGRTVNRFWYLAGALASEEPALLEAVAHEQVRSSIAYYSAEIQAGSFHQLRLSFDDRAGGFDLAAFQATYEVVINGLVVPMESSDGVLEVPLGRVDVLLRRVDGGYGLAERVEVARMTEQFHFVLRNATKVMGTDLLEQLRQYPNECSPPLAPQVTTDLEIYAALHPASEIHLAVAEADGARGVRVWRWDRDSRQLALVHRETAVFPVRFSLIGSTGAATSSFAVQRVGSQALGTRTDRLWLLSNLLPRTSAALDGVPLSLQLRGHVRHLMMGVGVQLTVGEAGDDSFVDRYATGPGAEAIDDQGRIFLKRRAVQQQAYVFGGGVLGPRAADGMGPRGSVRLSVANVPHVVSVSAHGGLTTRLGDLPGDRHSLLADVDGYGGVMIPLPGSVYAGVPLLAFGATAGLGFTF